MEGGLIFPPGGAGISVKLASVGAGALVHGLPLTVWAWAVSLWTSLFPSVKWDGVDIKIPFQL